MNQRRDSRAINPIIILTVVGIVLAAAVYWFVIRDASDDKGDGPKNSGPVAAKTFTAPGNSFSVKYPGNFVETTGPQGYVWIAGVGTYDILSVKRIENKPTGIARLRATIPDTLMLVPGTKINEQGTAEHGGTKMATFDIDTTVDGQDVSVKLYYFSANGVTWQFGCESQKQEAVIDAACTAALDSFQAG